MKLTDCEIVHLHIRGTNVRVVFGDRSLEPAEAQDLLSQYFATYGAVRAPGYVSPDGWQSLEAAPVAATKQKQPAAPVGDGWTPPRELPPSPRPAAKSKGG